MLGSESGLLVSVGGLLSAAVLEFLDGVLSGGLHKLEEVAAVAWVELVAVAAVLSKLVVGTVEAWVGLVAVAAGLSKLVAVSVEAWVELVVASVEAWTKLVFDK